MLGVRVRGATSSRRRSRAGPSRTRRTGGARRRPAWPAARKGTIGLSGQMHGLVVLDADDRVLRPAILWNDQRTAAECAEIEARVGLERLIELTGNRALTGFTAPKLLWLRRHEPEIYARIRHVLLPKDYVRLPADRRARDRRRRRVRDAALRRRRTAMVGRGLRCPRRAARLAAARRTSRRRSPAQAIRRPQRSASASSARGRSRSCSARRASSSRRCPHTRPTRRHACTSSATPCRIRGTRWASC